VPVSISSPSYRAGVGESPGKPLGTTDDVAFEDGALGSCLALHLFVPTLSMSSTCSYSGLSPWDLDGRDDPDMPLRYDRADVFEDVVVASKDAS
jgi:hypothetical protein